MKGEKMYFSNDFTHAYNGSNNTLQLRSTPITCHSPKVRMIGEVATEFTAVAAYVVSGFLLLINLYRGSVPYEENDSGYIAQLQTNNDIFFLAESLPHMLIFRGIAEERIFAEFSNDMRIQQGEQLAVDVGLLETFVNGTIDAGSIKYTVEVEVIDA